MPWVFRSIRGIQSITLEAAALILIAVVTIVAAPSEPQDSNADSVVVHPVDSGAALDNPGMGWIFHYYGNGIARYGSRLAPADTVDEFPGLTVIYLRLAWAYLEPEEGVFNWAVVDSPAQRWIAKGKKIALRFTTSETGQMYATPEWVRKAGARGTFTKNRQVVMEGGVWEPDFDDPVFLEKLDRFMAAAGRRYDGNPNVAFVDVGTRDLRMRGFDVPVGIDHAGGLLEDRLDLRGHRRPPRRIRPIDFRDEGLQHGRARWHFRHLELLFSTPRA